MANKAQAIKAKGNAARVGRYGTKHGGRNLNDEVMMWPNPTSRDWKDGSAQACKNVPKNRLLGREVHTNGTKAVGSLNPTWVEWLMGFPSAHTDLQPSAMP